MNLFIYQTIVGTQCPEFKSPLREGQCQTFRPAGSQLANIRLVEYCNTSKKREGILQILTRSEVLNLITSQGDVRVDSSCLLTTVRGKRSRKISEKEMHTFLYPSRDGQFEYPKTKKQYIHT
jgi:hypothetical protein